MDNNKDYKRVLNIYSSLQKDWDRQKPLWDKISRYVGISVDSDYKYNQASNAKNGRSFDEYIDDPTSAISVNQAGDYLCGVMWGTGEGVFDLLPSRHVLELTDTANVADYYGFATDQVLYHMNHPEAGYLTSLKPYAYDQVGFGTSGIGAFKNKNFPLTESNAVIYRNYGVDNVVIGAGKSGLVDYCFATFHWDTSQIVGEFAGGSGTLDTKRFATLPKCVREAYEKGNLTEVFTLIFGMLPRDDFDPKLKGKRGTRYRGVWFLKNSNDMDDKRFFLEEDFAEKPINIARMILTRGSVYGRASGTMLINTISAVDYMVGTSIEVIEKMADPALGTFSNAVFGDSVLDSSASGLTVFNSALMGGNGAGGPVFPLYDVGDPSALVQFLIPYLNEKLTTAFKIDALLDFSSEKEMTATESLKRYTIRGQSLSGMLLQQKNERLIPDIKRSVSICQDAGELGVNPRTNEAAAAELKKRGKTERIIPREVLAVMERGLPWYEIRFHNELEKLIRTEKVQNLLQVLNAVMAVASVHPDIVEAIDWYALVKEVKDNLAPTSKIMYSAREFKENIAALAQQRAAANAVMMGEKVAGMQKSSAQAGQAIAEANRG